MCAKKVTKAPAEVETTGHEWDGIEESEQPDAALVGLGVLRHHRLGHLVHHRLSGMAADQRRNARAIWARTPAPMWRPRSSTFDDGQRRDQGQAGRSGSERHRGLIAALADYAQRAGAAVFKTNCAQCHGAGRAGVQGKGYPNLLDDDWLWGGTMEDIHLTITHGIRNTTDADARYSEMPKFGVDELLEPAQIGEVVEYVLQPLGPGA